MVELDMVEKVIIFASTLAALPLFFLDKEVLGFRRFAWLGAFCTNIYVQFFTDPTVGISGQQFDRFTMAFLSLTIVPHFVQLVKDNMLLGFAIVPPLFVVLYLSTQTSLDSPDYWKLRAFLHAVFFLPYLNHLPTGEEQQQTEETASGEEETEEKEEPKQKLKKTNKKKR
jgi:hypothetical protein